MSNGGLQSQHFPQSPRVGHHHLSLLAPTPHPSYHALTPSTPPPCHPVTLSPCHPVTLSLAQPLKAFARALGFDLVAIAPAGPSPDHDRYTRWLEAGYAGEMGYLARHSALKTDPRSLLPEAQSLILVGLSYARGVDPARRTDPSRGQIAAYALSRDYHDVMRGMLKELDGWLRAQTGRSTHGRVFVDSAPVLERSWAVQAGLGFIGKNTCLIHPALGSDLVLGGLLVPEILESESGDQRAEVGGQRTDAFRNLQSPISNLPFPLTCGHCTRCLDVCPTGALVSAHALDARRCISYLTIELRGEIPPDLRPQMGNWVFGCDLCQAVCPWNRAAARRSSLAPPSPALLDPAPPLLDLLALDPATFAGRFARTPILRAGFAGFLRNVCVAAGNWGDPAVLPALDHHLNSSPLLVASHAAWALGQLAGGVGRPVLAAAWERTPASPLRHALAAALSPERTF